MSTRGPALTLGVVVALVSGVTLGNGGANVMPVFVDDFAARFDLSDSSAGLVAATQLMATAVVTLLLAERAARPKRVRMVRAGLLLAALGFLGATAAFDPVTLILANLVIGAGLGAVYAAATAALAATDDADKASAVTIAGTVCVTALLIVAVPLANHDLGEGAGFLLMALCCAAAWPLVRHLPDGPAEPATQDATAAPAARRCSCSGAPRSCGPSPRAPGPTPRCWAASTPACRTRRSPPSSPSPAWWRWAAR
ncbi:MFS transporter [Streptomyces niveiscabiei]|uniref:MFS transporter n=1 Tax=Streptomyces niveiscabiei TaxID=164115 RepID=A0ABW9HKM7_9ACTN